MVDNDGQVALVCDVDVLERGFRFDFVLHDDMCHWSNASLAGSTATLSVRE